MLKSKNIIYLLSFVIVFFIFFSVSLPLTHGICCAVDWGCGGLDCESWEHAYNFYDCDGGTTCIGGWACLCDTSCGTDCCLDYDCSSSGCCDAVCNAPNCGLSPNNADCDDGLVCTDDVCNSDCTCSHTLKPGYCFIGGVCQADGDKNPANPCQYCDSSSSIFTWTDITACIDNDGCCPSGCNANNDNDCSAQCGNDVVESGEECEKPNTNPPSNPASTCPSDGWYDTGNTRCVASDLECADKEQKEQELRDYYCGSGCTCGFNSGGTQWVDTGNYCPLKPGYCFIGGVCQADGDKNPANPCQYCDSSSSIFTWTDITACIDNDGCCPSGCDYTNDNDCPSPGCSCTAWVNDVCGGGGCAVNYMHQTRTCDPAGCDLESRCVADSCGPWVDAGCGVSPCSSNQMKQTRTCTYGCLPTYQCVGPSYGPWINQGCGASCGSAGVCSATQQCQKKTDSYGCAPDQYQCVEDPSCVCPGCCDGVQPDCVPNDAKCNDGDPCTIDNCKADCTCDHTDITNCIDNDNCCPPGCNANNDNDCSAQCGNDVVESGEQCELPNTNPPSNPASTCPSDGWYCSNTVRENRDYKCGSSCQCTYDLISSEDCAAKASVDFSDGGDVPGTAGYCRDYITCADGNNAYCTHTDNDDDCVSTTHLKETYASGSSCLTNDYYCSDFEVLASGDPEDDPTDTVTCHGGKAAGCSSDAFWQSPKPSITEGCIDSSDCFSNGGPGGANCLFREAYSVDSDDPCSGKDACTSKNYDPDTNSNTCNACAGSNRWSIGGEIAATTCCGDDANEYKLTRVCEPGSCTSSSSDDACCNSDDKCVWNSVCYFSGSTHPTNDCWYCDSGTWRNKDCGVSCTNAAGSPGVCDASGNCYTKAGAQINCQGVLNCSVPGLVATGICLNVTPTATDCNSFSDKASCNANSDCVWYDRDLPNDCGVSRNGNGLHKCKGDYPWLTFGSVCHKTLCQQTDSCQQITGEWTSIEYPDEQDICEEGNGLWYKDYCTYRIGNVIRVKVHNISVTSGFTPLLECKLTKILTKEDGTDVVKGGIYFDRWVSTSDVVFKHTIQSDDPTGYWTIDYCVLVTDFYKNYGWTLNATWSDPTWTKKEFCVGTKLAG